jgi:methionyl-tRNA formyltransferase
LPSFDAVFADPYFDVVGVVTAAPRAAGRSGELQPTPVARWARERELDLLETGRIREKEALETISSLGATVGLLVDFGQIVPVELLSALPRGALNLHPSLLPKFRGASPIPAVIIAGDLDTGVSTIVMDDGLDTGPLLNVQRYPLKGDEAAPDLETRLALLASESITDTLKRYLSGALRPEAQPADGVSLTKRLTRADGAVQAATHVDAAYRAWRAYRPWPGIWVSVAPLLDRLILDEVGEPERGVQVEPGCFAEHEGTLMLGLQGGALPLLQVIPTGGRRMTGAELLRGRPELLAPHARITS